MDSNMECKIAKLEIKGLFGLDDVSIPFDNKIKILIGENGSGKTTILNILYYTLNCDYRKLSALPFNSVEITFSSGKKVFIKQKDLEKGIEENFDIDVLDFFKSRLSTEEFHELVISAINSRYEFNNLIEANFKSLPFPQSYAIRELRRIFHSPNTKNSHTKKTTEVIRKEITEEILYLPTYRRIEEDLNKLGVSNVKIRDESLINFGMDDVKRRIEDCRKQIRDSALMWFAKVNGEMLTQLVDGINVTSEMRASIQNPAALKIVLQRTGENLSQTYKDKIYQLISSNDFYYDEKYDPLIYFLSNLVKIYDQQRELDNAIKKFAEVCNKYLGATGKEFVYDESTVELSLYHTKYGKRTNKIGNLSNLSSGEKQIVSLFARLYLNRDADRRSYIIIFDEPELSLSTEWQSQLLPDIVDSGKCSLLFAVTHSPFIFDNELDIHARSLDMYVSNGIVEEK